MIPQVACDHKVSLTENYTVSMARLRRLATVLQNNNLSTLCTNYFYQFLSTKNSQRTDVGMHAITFVMYNYSKAEPSLTVYN